MANEIFQLPDGTKVGTGNIVDTSGVKLRAQPFPDYLLLEDKDIERLMKAKSLAANREKRRKVMSNQGQIGSCNWYMIAGMKYQIDELSGLPLKPLAPEHGYARTCGGADNGSLLKDGMYQMIHKGCASHGLFPYERFLLRDCKDLAKADADAMNNRIHEPYYLPLDFKSYCRALASAIARDMTAGIAWDVVQASMKLQNGYIQVGRGRGNHATQVHDGKWVGGVELVHPDLKNTWGPTTDPRFGRVTKYGWGEGGYGLATMEQLYATRAYHEHYVMTSPLMPTLI